MFKRLELHNHTTESDAGITTTQLTDFMVQEKVDAFAITDHNTMSPHVKIKEYIKKNNLPVECIYGMEYTTYYGHILCFNLDTYISWENINKHNPEKLFYKLRKAGAIIGIAHPFSYGAPLAQGCRWEMDITDFTSFDFIEVINNSEPLETVNMEGIEWWQMLCLSGKKLAMTAGMDLHGIRDLNGKFATYINVDDVMSLDKALAQAIKTQQTYITRGPVFFSELVQETSELRSTITDIWKTGFETEHVEQWIIEYISPSGSMSLTIENKKIKQSIVLPPFNLNNFSDSTVIISKLYMNDKDINNLVAISPVIYN